MLVELNLNLMWQNTQLTKILNMNYTKFSQTTRIRLVYKLYIDVELKKEIGAQYGDSIPVLPSNLKSLSKSPAPKTKKPRYRPRRLSGDFDTLVKGLNDYESDMDSNIDSQSFDSENFLADFTKEQFETDFQYVESRVFTDVDNTKHIVILDMKNNSRLLIEAKKLLRYC